MNDWNLPITIWQLKIYDMGDDCEWWVGVGTPEDFKETYLRVYDGSDCASYATECTPRELTDEELDSLPYYEDHPTLGWHVARTFREQLTREDHANPEPRYFAGSEG